MPIDKHFEPIWRILSFVLCIVVIGVVPGLIIKWGEAGGQLNPPVTL
jgi:hypothetical protein